MIDASTVFTGPPRAEGPVPDKVTAVLLPGLDGSGLLFDPFLETAPPGWSFRPLSFNGWKLDPLVDELAPQLPAGPHLMIAESFSTPLAVMLAACQPNVQGLVLVSPFVTPPRSPLFAKIPWRPLLELGLPEFVARALMVDRTTPRKTSDRLRRAVAEVSTSRLEARIRTALKVDVREQLRDLEIPILLVRARYDRLVSAAAWSQVRATVPRATASMVDGPHLLLQTRPTAVWQAINAHF